MSVSKPSCRSINSLFKCLNKSFKRQIQCWGLPNISNMTPDLICLIWGQRCFWKTSWGGCTMIRVITPQSGAFFFVWETYRWIYNGVVSLLYICKLLLDDSLWDRWQHGCLWDQWHKIILAYNTTELWPIYKFTRPSSYKTVWYVSHIHFFLPWKI